MRIILYVLVNLTEVQNHGIMNAFFGLIQLIIALLLAVVALYICYTIFSNITKGMDKKRV
jgi:L-asparagine transporter-like permease